jgi:hypothetical protein
MLKLFRSTLAAAFLLAVYPQLAEGFIKRPPPTLVVRFTNDVRVAKSVSVGPGPGTFHVLRS